MSLTIETIQQISADIYGEGQAGERPHLAGMTCSWRPGKRMSLSLEITDEAAAAAQGGTMAEQVSAFFAEALARCQAAGLPVPAGESE